MDKRKIDVGDRFGRLTVTGFAGKNKHGQLLIECVCDCGLTCIVEKYDLTRGAKTQCNPYDHTMLGKRFGHLVVERYAGSDKGRGALFECLCDCGNKTVVPGHALKRKNTASCGCGEKENHKNVEANFVTLAKEWHKEGTHTPVISSKPTKANTSGIRGVHYAKERNQWVARLRFKGKTYHLGYYDSLEEAAEARREAEEAIFDPYLEKLGLPPTSEGEYKERLREATERHERE